MRFDRSQIEDQIIATLRANATISDNNVQIATHVGDINPATFLDKVQMEGFIKKLPAIYVQYQGKRKVQTDSTKQTVYYNLRWRFYVCTQSLRGSRGSQLSAYLLLSALYDSLHGKIPNSTDNSAYVVPKLDGEVIVSPFTAPKPFETPDGEDEKLLVILPGVVVYQSDFVVTVMA